MTEAPAVTEAEAFVPTASKTRLSSIAVPANWLDLITFCESIAKSSLIPSNFKDKPADLAIAISMGNEVGMHWTHAIQSIAVINGRPSLWGDGALAVVQSHRDYEWHSYNESTDACGVAIFKRKGHEPERVEFTLEDARKAGLLNKDTYKQHQGQMLLRRAAARCMARKFADALRGMGLADDAPAEKLVGSGSAADEPAPKSKAKEVQERLAARKTNVTDAIHGGAHGEVIKVPDDMIDNATGEILDAELVVKKLAEAKTIDELKDAADLARSIKDETKKGEARAAYKAGLKRLRGGK